MTLETIKAGKYDWTALLGVLVAAWPTIQTHVLSTYTLPPLWAAALQCVGLLLAAWGRPVVVRPAAPQRMADFEDTP